VDSSLAFSAAAVAADPADPTSWVSLGKSLGSALGLFGGSGVYAQNKGIRLVGNFGAGGFSGSAYTITTDGNNPFSGAEQTINAELGSNYGADIARLFGPSTAIPIDVTSATADWGGPTGIFQTLRSYLDPGIARAKQMSDQTTNTISAPDLTGAPAVAGNAPISNPGVSSGGSSTIAPKPMAAPAIGAASFAGLPAWAVYLLIAYAAYHLWKGAGRG
jgi:hypothetical protein